MRSPTPGREHMLSRWLRVAWSTPRAAAAGVPGGPRAHSARKAHIARPHNPQAPAQMMHMNRERGRAARARPRAAR
eukprot:5776721-Prymnesium_polylepis.1